MFSKFTHGSSKMVGAHEAIEQDFDILIRQMLNDYLDNFTPRPKVWKDIKNRVIGETLNVGRKTSC